MFGRGKKRSVKTVAGWFEMSYASWLTLPRVLMQEMPPKWQEKMVDLLDEFHAEFPNAFDECDDIHVTSRKSGKITKLPEWLNDYKQPDNTKIFLARGDK